MTARKLVNTKNMPKSEWLNWRMGGVGGSDIAPLFGFSPYKNSVGVWLEKTGRRTAVEENFKMKMGNLLEPTVAQLFAEEHPEMKIRHNHFLLQHETIDCMLANIDREIICPKRGRGVLEIKTTGEYLKNRWTADTVPDEYMFQLQHYFAVTGYQFGYLAVLIGGNTDYKSYLVERNEKIIAGIEKAALDFWEYVKADKAPELDGTEASNEALKYLYPPDQSTTEEVELPFDVELMLYELQEIKKKKDALDEQKGLLQARVIQMLGNAQIGRSGGYWVTWKPQTKSIVDGALLKEKYPEIHAEVLKKSESRPFLVKFKGE